MKFTREHGVVRARRKSFSTTIIPYAFLQLIGWTPLVEMKNIAKKDGIKARLVGKMEAYQPLCSVKDRNALQCRTLSITSFSKRNCN
jgi:hypothetical protein